MQHTDEFNQLVTLYIAKVGSFVHSTGLVEWKLCVN